MAATEAREVARRYEPSGDRPLGGYVAVVGVYGALTGASALAVLCVGQWVATAMVGGLLVAPRLTRVVAAGMTVVAAADALNLAYDAAQQRTG